MANPHELIQGVTFNNPDYVDVLEYNAAYGLLQDATADGLRVVGFATPIAYQGGIDPGETVRPLTGLIELPPESQTISEQGKGVGVRLYNTLAGARSGPTATRVKPAEIGLYAADLDAHKILDLREAQGGRLRQIARQAGRIVRSAGGLERVVDGIHRSYGDADAVLLKQPPHPEARQKMHGVANPIDVNPAFLIIRNPNLRLHRVGTAPSPW